MLDFFELREILDDNGDPLFHSQGQDAVGSLRAASFGRLRCQVKVRNGGKGSLAVYVKKGGLAMPDLPLIVPVRSGFNMTRLLSWRLAAPPPHLTHTLFSRIPPEGSSTHLPSADRQWPPSSYIQKVFCGIHLSCQFWFLSQSAGSVSLI